MIQREEVERLAADVERNAIYDTGTKAGITAYGYRMIATMLRDLVAERDAARRVSQAFEVETEKAHANSKRWRAERDAAREEVGRLREALWFYASYSAHPDEGPWGVNSKDFGNRARAALKGPTP